MLKKLSVYPADERRAFRVMQKDQTRRGFTLFEVSISLVLVAFGVISVMMLFPIGIKAEQMARMRIFAAVKAEELLDSFATLPKDNPGIDVEAPNAWEVAVAHRPLVPDLEARMLSSRNGIMSVPMDIVRRLESENDEIQKVVQQGGHLYYSKATGTSGFQESSEGFRNSPKDPLTQRVVFAVMGSAQNNAVSILPQKAWPYYNAYPSPPSFGMVGGYYIQFAINHPGATADTFKSIYFRNAEQPSNPPDSTDVSFMETNDRYRNASEGWGEYAFSLWEGTNGGVLLGSGETATGSLDPDIRLVFTNGYRPYLLSRLYDYTGLADKDAFTVPQSDAPNGFYRTLAGARRYVQAALWYCQKKGIELGYYQASPGDSSAAVAQAQTQANLFRSVPEKDKWKYVQAIRFLAHATSCLTAYPGSAVGTGISIPSVDFPFARKDIATATTPLVKAPVSDMTMNNYTIVYYHELSMRMAMLYAASQPYDWGAPRPSQRALFTDNPLIEYDLISGPSNPKVGPISGAAVGVNGRQWRPIPARPIANIGRSASFLNTAIDPSATWGNSANFTLAKQFEPAERCRELVFWSVDWLSYVDAETAPSILDASRIPFAAPIIVPTVPALASFANTNSMRLDYWRSRTQFVNSFLNPEMDRAFSNDVTQFPTGFYWPIRDNATGGNNGQNDQRDKNGNTSSIFDEIPNSVRIGVNINAGQILWWLPYLKSGEVHYSRFGADRNGNRTLDRGPVQQSTRLRATLLARYNFYDPRLTLRLR